MSDYLRRKYVRLLESVNDEEVSVEEHRARDLYLRAWLASVGDATKRTFNGDHHYIPMIESGEMKKRPMCCGVFLDWRSRA